MDEKMIQLGRYQHYKSANIYQVIGFAIHSEALEEMVIYKALHNSEKYGDNSVWVRPKKMFFENVSHNGLAVPCFQIIETIV